MLYDHAEDAINKTNTGCDNIWNNAVIIGTVALCNRTYKIGKEMVKVR
jgi:hypothetical protein